MASPIALYTKNVTTKLSFLLVTHTTCFDTWYGRVASISATHNATKFAGLHISRMR
jgi:hypothetical protein